MTKKSDPGPVVVQDGSLQIVSETIVDGVALLYESDAYAQVLLGLECSGDLDGSEEYEWSCNGLSGNMHFSVTEDTTGALIMGEFAGVEDGIEVTVGVSTRVNKEGEILICSDSLDFVIEVVK